MMQANAARLHDVGDWKKISTGWDINEVTNMDRPVHCFAGLGQIHYRADRISVDSREQKQCSSLVPACAPVKVAGAGRQKQCYDILGVL